MSMSAIAARVAAALLTSEKGRKGVGFLLVAIFAPVILIAAILCSNTAGGADHNNLAVEASFYGVNFTDSVPAEFQTHITDMQTAFSLLDSAVAEANATMTDGNRLDPIQVKAIAVGHIRVGFRHRRIQKGESSLHIRDVRLELDRHRIRKAGPVERRFDRQIVVVSTTRCGRAEDCSNQDDRCKNSNQQKADAFAPLFAGQQCGSNLYEHRRWCHQRPPAFPNSASLYGGAWTSNR